MRVLYVTIVVQVAEAEEQEPAAADIADRDEQGQSEPAPETEGEQGNKPQTAEAGGTHEVRLVDGRNARECIFSFN